MCMYNLIQDHAVFSLLWYGNNSSDFVLHDLYIFKDYKQFYFVELSFACGSADVSL